jgi:hypothetical protein
MKDYKKLVVLEGGKEGQGGNTASKNDARDEIPKNEMWPKSPNLSSLS